MAHAYGTANIPTVRWPWPLQQLPEHTNWHWPGPGHAKKGSIASPRIPGKGNRQPVIGYVQIYTHIFICINMALEAGTLTIIPVPFQKHIASAANIQVLMREMFLPRVNYSAANFVCIFCDIFELRKGVIVDQVFMWL